MGLSDVLVPEWMRKEAEAQKAQEAERQRIIDKERAEARDRALLSALVAIKGISEWWQPFVKQLKLNELASEQIGLNISVKNISGGGHVTAESCAEIGSSYWVEVRSGGLPSPGTATSRHILVHYVPQEGGIKCYPDVGEPFTFLFYLNENRLGLCRDGEPVTPEEAADQIAQLVVQLIRHQKRPHLT